MANPTIGRVKCPHLGGWAEVRKTNGRNPKLYYISKAGMITPNLPEGQNWLMENTEFFSAAEVKEINENPIEFGRRFYDDGAPIQAVEQKDESEKQAPPKKDDSDWWDEL